MRAQTNGSEPERFCLDFLLPKSATFSLALYGVGAARDLAQAWAHKMTPMYQAHLSGVNFVNDLDWVYGDPAFVDELFVSSSAATKDRVAGMRRLLPRR